MIKKLSLCHKLKLSNSISLQPDDGNLWYFKLRLVDLTEFIFDISISRSKSQSLKYEGL